MLKIKLKRTGKKGEPHYRVVVAESTTKRSGGAVEEIGYYNPRNKPTTFNIEKDRVEYWLSKGAQPTETVYHYLVKSGMLKAKKKGSTLSKGKKKKKNTEA